MKAKVKGRYEAHKNNGSATVSINVGQELVLKTTMTDATFVHGPSLTGLQLSLHKPNAFTLHYSHPTKDVGFQFMNKATIMDRTVNITYNHAHGSHETAVVGSMAFDQANKALVGYSLDSGNWRVKYVYERGMTVLEPCYDVLNNAWDFTLSKRLDCGDLVRATYHTVSKDLGVEWKRKSKITGSFKFQHISHCVKRPWGGMEKEIKDQWILQDFCVSQSGRAV